MSKAHLPRSVLALTPSQGCGGGIEKYSIAVLDAIRALGVEVVELALSSTSSSPGPATKARYLARVVRTSIALRRTNSEVMCFHAGLLPASLIARRCVATQVPITAFFYGIDIWTAGVLGRVLRRRSSIRPVTISSFSAGTMVGVGSPLILRPGVPSGLFKALVAIDRPSRETGEVRILSVFRLEDYAYKGGCELVDALATVRAEGHRVTLTVAGRDGFNDLLERDIDRHREWIRVVRSPSESELVACYAEAGLLVLATRQQRRPYPAGEGFGIVLTEAALAGLPVIAPANGGSRDAFIEGVTGVSPRDESQGSLTHTLRWILKNSESALQMGQNARRWAAQAFDPASYTARIAEVLWGRGDENNRWLGLRLELEHEGEPRM